MSIAINGSPFAAQHHPASPSATETPYGGTLKGIFTILHWATPLVGLLCGSLLGASVTFAPVQAALVALEQNCTVYSASSSCSEVSRCKWTAASSSSGVCVFRDGIDCTLETTASTCTAVSDHCQWLPSSSWCVHNTGYSSMELMLLYATVLLGSVFGALLSYRLLRCYGLRRSILVAGYTALVACAGVHASTVASTPTILFCARGLLGVACGIASCVGPLYVFKHAPASYHRIAGVLFHIGGTMCGAICGFVGLVITPRSFDGPMHMVARKEALASIPLLPAVGLVIVAHLMPAPDATLLFEVDDPHPDDVDHDRSPFLEGQSPVRSPIAVVVPDSYGTLTTPLNSASARTPTSFTSPLRAVPMLPPPPRYLADQLRVIALLALLGVSDQLTGFGAVMLFAPTITTTSVDVSPLAGNFFLQVWCFAGSLVSLLLVLRTTLRNLFAVGLAFVCVGCCIIAASCWDGLLNDDDSRRASTGLGVAMFICGYEMGVGPVFYPLSIAVQPGTIRAVSTAFTMTARFTLQTAIVVLFPMAAASIFPTTTSKDLVNNNDGSGDALLNIGVATGQRLSLIFLFFAGVAGLCSVAIIKALPRFAA